MSFCLSTEIQNVLVGVDQSGYFASAVGKLSERVR